MRIAYFLFIAMLSFSQAIIAAETSSSFGEIATFGGPGSTGAQLIEDISRAVPDVPVADLLEVADYEVPEGWDDALEYAVSVLRVLDRSKISIEAGKVRIKGAVANEDTRRRVEADLARLADAGIPVDVVFEHVGSALWESNLKCLARGGRLVTCGATTGGDAETMLGDIFWKQLSVLGSSMGSMDEFREVTALFRAGKLKPVIDKVYPSSQAAASIGGNIAENAGGLRCVKYGVTRDFTLDATVTPAFGQVEVDPAVVNLSEYEVFFEEKRPFFTEGSQTFTNFGRSGASEYWTFYFPEPILFYSRRIGKRSSVISIGGSSSSAISFSMVATSGWSRLTTPSVHCSPWSPLSRNPRYPCSTTRSRSTSTPSTSCSDPSGQMTSSESTRSISPITYSTFSGSLTRVMMSISPGSRLMLKSAEMNSTTCSSMTSVL